MSTTYNSIVSTVVELMEDDSQEFLNYIPRAIKLAQARLEDQVDSERLNETITVTAVPNNRLILKPTNLRFINTANISVSTTGQEKALDKASEDYLRDYWPIPTSVGEPRYIAEDRDDTYFMIAPTPASAYHISMNVRNDIIGISAANPENLLTKRFGNVFLYATIKEQASFSKDPALVAEYEQKYLDAVQAVNNRGRRLRSGDGGTVAQVGSGNNTLLGTQ